MSQPSDERRPARRRLSRLAGLLLALRAARRALGALRRSRSGLQLEPGASEPEPGAAVPPIEPPPGTDPSRREVPANPRAEMLVAVLLLLAAALGFGFTAAYVVDGTNPQLLGAALGGALALLAAACVVAGKLVVPQQTSVQKRDVLLHEDADEQVLGTVAAGGEGISRRALLTGAAGIAGAGLATAAATPLASLGPNLRGIHETPWHRGVRLVDEHGAPYLAADIEVGTFYTALPEHGDPESFGAGLIVVRLPASLIHLPAARRLWAPGGILAYSKICPHAGCAISLYRYPTYAPTSDLPALTCPCHYSTFLPGEGGRVIFGPAGRALSQLPLLIDADGALRAAAGFHEDIGPSWWSVRRSQS